MLFYDNLASSIHGIAFFIAFLLTFSPHRHRTHIAAILWCVCALYLTATYSFSIFLDGYIASARARSSGFPVLAWLIPVILIILNLIEAVLLHPRISQNRALKLGRILWLIVVPAVVLALSLRSRGAFAWSSIGAAWLGYPVLWFRIRENYGSVLQSESLQERSAVSDGSHS